MSSSAAGRHVSAPDAGESRTYRQYLRAGRRPIVLLTLLGILWGIGGGAAWLLFALPPADLLQRTVVTVLWVGWLMAIVIPVLVGPRGPFRGWWWPRMIIQANDQGLAWWTEGSVRRPQDGLAWSAVSSVGPTFPSPGRPPGADCALSAPDGRVLARLPCRLERIDRPVSGRRRLRRVVWLPDVAVAVRPDRFERRRVLGRRASLREPDSA